jgi:phosphinothricin acetyltransferase
MIIRLALVNDTEQILSIYSPYVKKTVISFEYTVPSKEEMETRIRNISQRYPWIVLEENNEILGYAYASKHRERSAYRWSVDISIYVKEGYLGRGIGKALYTSLFEILKCQRYRNAYAGICLPNEKSVGIHEHFGFKKIAQYNKVGYKFGKWYDTGWWELFLQDHDSAPGEPVPISDVEQSKLTKAFECGIKALMDAK